MGFSGELSAGGGQEAPGGHELCHGLPVLTGVESCLVLSALRAHKTRPEVQETEVISREPWSSCAYHLAPERTSIQKWHSYQNVQSSLCFIQQPQRSSVQCDRTPYHSRSVPDKKDTSFYLDLVKSQILLTKPHSGVLNTIAKWMQGKAYDLISWGFLERAVE